MKCNTIKALVVPADPAEPVRLADVAPTLDTFQTIVGGFIEGITVDGVAAYIHEEGKLENLPGNPRATAYMLDARMIFPFDVIAGALVLVGDDGNGTETDISAAAVDRFATVTGAPIH